jgi:hypothetical protein
MIIGWLFAEILVGQSALRAGRNFLLSKVLSLTSFTVAYPYFSALRLGKIGNQKTEASTNFANTTNFTCLIEELHVEMYWKCIYSNICQSKKN